MDDFQPKYGQSKPLKLPGRSTFVMLIIVKTS